MSWGVNRRVRFTEVVVGLQLDDGCQGVYIPGDEEDLTPTEFDQLKNRWFDELRLAGPPMELEGTILLCEGECGKLWRRTKQFAKVKVCRECVMASPHGKRGAAKSRYLRLG